MNLVFFEGFNSNNNDTIKLDSNYWYTSEIYSYSSGISFYDSSGGARTDNAISINGYYNQKINLINFNSPLNYHNAFGVGFFITRGAINSNLISFSSSGNPLLNINFIRNNNNIALEILQNNISKNTYFFKDVVGNNYDYFKNNYTGEVYGINNIYLEFYIDAKNTNSLRIRANGLDMIDSSSGNITSISGFSDMDTITLYGSSHGQTINVLYDDFYLTGGNTIDDTLLGSNVRIYQLNTSSNSSSNMQWLSNTSTQASVLNSNDGDNSYCFANTVNSMALFNMSDLPVASGSIGGIKLNNTARKVSDNVSFTNIYASGEGASVTGIGTTYNLTDASYKSCNSFVFKNPLTNNDWTIEEINSMQVGFTKLL